LVVLAWVAPASADALAADAGAVLAALSDDCEQAAMAIEVAITSKRRGGIDIPQGWCPQCGPGASVRL
jgi:hypothetical protein